MAATARAAKQRPRAGAAAASRAGAAAASRPSRAGASRASARSAAKPPRTRLRIVRRGGAAARPAASGLLDRLVRGPGWIAAVGVLLAGVVFFNVSLLELNRGITRDSTRASELRRANAELRVRVARLASSERIQRAAAQRGFVLPAPGEVRYLRADPARDARLAAERIEPPSETPAVAQAPLAAAQPPGGAPPAAAAPPAAGAPPAAAQPPAAQAPPAAAAPPTAQAPPPAAQPAPQQQQPPAAAPVAQQTPGPAGAG